MIVARLAYVNAKRIWRQKSLRVLLIALPFAFAIPRAAFAKNIILLRSAELFPLICAVILCAVLDVQWSMDKAAGLMAGLLSSPVSRRAIIASRAVSGAAILAAQVGIFGAILAIRF